VMFRAAMAGRAHTAATAMLTRPGIGGMATPASVDTPNPAIGGQGKTGHRSGRSRPGVLQCVLAARASRAPITDHDGVRRAMAEAAQESAIISLAVGLGGYPDSAPHHERGS
jgi:hypothetical protein